MNEVAKFGGSSMAQPEHVESQLEHSLPDVVVVSAPGVDESNPRFHTKVTDALRRTIIDTDYIKTRYEQTCERLQLPVDYRYELDDQIMTDLRTWTDRKDPVDALGEKWAAQVLAEKTHREFVDATEVIRFNQDGTLNEEQTTSLIQLRFLPGVKYVVPGYYGADENGSIHTFPRGGSDITGALIARALKAKEYHNWSDVRGFMTADPRVVGGENARLLDEITYLETRNMGICGAALLHIAVRDILEGTGIPTVMRNTFGSQGNRGTMIVDQRDWEATRPVISVSGMPAFQLYAHRRGAHDEDGATLEMVQALSDSNISFHQEGSGGDDFAYFVAAPDVDAKDGKGIQRLEELLGRFDEMEQRLGEATELQISTAGMLHIIGEGLRESGRERGRAVGMATLTLGDNYGGASDIAKSGMATLFVEDTESSQLVNAEGVRKMQQIVNQTVRSMHSGLSLAS